jgi:hypothetical protein
MIRKDRDIKTAAYHRYNVTWQPEYRREITERLSEMLKDRHDHPRKIERKANSYKRAENYYLMPPKIARMIFSTLYTEEGKRGPTLPAGLMSYDAGENYGEVAYQFETDYLRIKPIRHLGRRASTAYPTGVVGSTIGMKGVDLSRRVALLGPQEDSFLMIRSSNFLFKVAKREGEPGQVELSAFEKLNDLGVYVVEATLASYASGYSDGGAFTAQLSLMSVDSKLGVGI